METTNKELLDLETRLQRMVKGDIYMVDEYEMHRLLRGLFYPLPFSIWRNSMRHCTTIEKWNDFEKMRVDYVFRGVNQPKKFSTFQFISKWVDNVLDARI